MNIVLRSIALGILVALSGCVPHTDTFYAPSASDGTISADELDGYVTHYALKDIRLVRGNHISITVDGGMFIDQPENNNRIIINIRVPADEILQFPISDIKISSPDSMVRVTLTGYICQRHAIDKLLGNETELKGGRCPGDMGIDYTLYETFDGPKPDVFYVELPSMRAGNKSYPPLNIQFKKTTRQWFPAWIPAT